MHAWPREMKLDARYDESCWALAGWGRTRDSKKTVMDGADILA